MMKEVDIQIRRAQTLQDYQAVVELQKDVWGFTETQDVAALPMLLLANRFGGNVLVAEDAAARIVGFSFAILGRRDGKLFWWSHMTAVASEYRNKDLGFRLKLRQRQDALAARIGEIDWTFDPLQATNAYFNVRKLGVIVRKYEENIYGHSSSPLHQDLPTDRFVAEWHLNSERVRDRLSAGAGPVILRDIDRISRINVLDGEPNLRLEESPLLMEIPGNVTELKSKELVRARSWLEKTRVACLHYFAGGYTVTDFIQLVHPRPQALYVLERNAARNGSLT